MKYKIRFKNGKWRIVVVVDHLEIPLPFEYKSFEEAKSELCRATTLKAS